MGEQVSEVLRTRSGGYSGKDGLRHTGWGCALWIIAFSATGQVLTLQSPNEATNGYFGRAVAVLPDVDHDGRSDLAIGADNESPADGLFGDGRVYVYSGDSGAHLYTLGGSDNQVAGFGRAADGVPDINADQRGEVLVGAPLTNRPGPVIDITHAGKAFLYSVTGELLYTFQASTPVFNGRFGQAVAAVPDIDGDGIADFAIGAPGEGTCISCGGVPGRAVLYSGAAGTYLRDITSPNPQPGGEFGIALTGLTDVNGDGAGDLLVSQRGAAFVISGATGAVLRTLTHVGLNTMGLAVDTVPDTDEDGLADYLVGAVNGAALFSSANGALLAVFSADNGGNTPTGNFVAGVPDMTGDGRGEVAVGEPHRYAPPGTLGGIVTLYSFNETLGVWQTLQVLKSPNDQVNGRFGGAVAGIPDVSYDGAGDLLIGAWQDAPTPAPVAAGRAYRYVDLLPDAVPPQAAIEILVPVPTNLSTIPIEIAWQEPVVGFTSTDVETSPASINLMNFTDTGDGMRFTADVSVESELTTPVNVAISLTAGATQDNAGNPSNPVIRTFEYDPQPPLPTFSAAVGSVTTLASIPVSLEEMTRAEAMFGIDETQFLLQNATIANFSGQPGDAAFSFELLPISDGEVRVTLPAGTARDAAGNAQSADASLSFTFDGTPPEPVISSTASLWTNQPEFLVEVKWSEPVFGFDAQSVEVSNGVVALTEGADGDTVFQCRVTASAEGPVDVTVKPGAVIDLAGNVSTNSPQLTRNYDITPPTGAVDVAPIWNLLAPFEVTVAFDEPITTFDSDRVMIAGGELADWSGSSAGLSLSVQPLLEGAISLTLLDGAVLDRAGNPNQSTEPVQTVIDVTPPQLVALQRLDASPTNAAAVSYRVVFTETVTGVDAADFNLTTALPGAQIASVSGAGDTFDVMVSPGDNEGEISIALVDDDTIRDMAGLPLNGVGISVWPGPAYTIDRTPPQVSLGEPSAVEVGEGPLLIPVLFSGHDAVALQAGHVTLLTTGDVAGSVTIGGTSPDTREIRIADIVGNGTLRVRLEAGAAVDDAGNVSLPVESPVTVQVVQDADEDGIPDLVEGDGDPDGDGIPNYQDEDSDNDGMPDSYEVSVGLDPLVDDGALDPDGDGFNNLEEYLGGGHPLVHAVIPFLTVVSVDPPLFLTAGGTEIEIKGVRLDGNCQVLVNGRNARHISYDAASATLTATVPPSAPGSAVVRVVHPLLSQSDEWEGFAQYSADPFKTGADTTPGLVRAWEENEVQTFWGYLPASSDLQIASETGVRANVPHGIRATADEAFVLLRTAPSLEALFGHIGFIYPEDFGRTTPAVALQLFVRVGGQTVVWNAPFEVPIDVLLPITKGSATRPVDIASLPIQTDSDLRFLAMDLAPAIVAPAIDVVEEGGAVNFEWYAPGAIAGLRECVPGDVNCDGAIDAIDVQVVINAALGFTSPYTTSFNGDGLTDAADIQFVVNRALAP